MYASVRAHRHQCPYGTARASDNQQQWAQHRRQAAAVTVYGRTGGVVACATLQFEA